MQEWDAPKKVKRANKRTTRKWYGIGILAGSGGDIIFGYPWAGVAVGLGFMMSSLFRVKHEQRLSSLYGRFTILHSAPGGGPVYVDSHPGAPCRV